jgi:hypothetical protein
MSFKNMAVDRMTMQIHFFATVTGQLGVPVLHPVIAYSKIIKPA